MKLRTKKVRNYVQLKVHILIK